jgi:hypothetical protein
VAITPVPYPFAGGCALIVITLNTIATMPLGIAATGSSASIKMDTQATKFIIATIKLPI